MLSTFPNALNEFTKEFLEGSMVGLNYGALGGCLPKNHIPFDLVISNVTKYKSNNNFVTADVVLLFIRY